MSHCANSQDMELCLHFKKCMLLWRLGLGKWVNGMPNLSGRILVITHTGRNSGNIYHTPVNYTPRSTGISTAWQEWEARQTGIST